MKRTKLVILLALVLGATGCSNQNAGTAVGAASGAIIGGSIGVAGAGVGLGLGALVGVAVGTVFDHCAPSKGCENSTKHG